MDPEPGQVGEEVAKDPKDCSDARKAERSSHLAFVAHEVRNPLSTALWSAELLARMSPADRAGARGEKLAGMCLRALARVRLLFEDHLLSERLQVQGILVRPEPVRLAEAIQRLAGKQGVEAGLQLRMNPELSVWADPVLLERTLDPILAAAARERTPVTVTGEVEGEQVILRVAGSPPAEDALADPSRDAPSDPTGRALALPAARRAAGALGGMLTLADAAYVLKLPAADPAENGEGAE